jgi:hypothetical protein
VGSRLTLRNGFAEVDLAGKTRNAGRLKALLSPHQSSERTMKFLGQAAIGPAAKAIKNDLTSWPRSRLRGFLSRNLFVSSYIKSCSVSSLIDHPATQYQQGFYE